MYALKTTLTFLLFFASFTVFAGSPELHQNIKPDAVATSGDSVYQVKQNDTYYSLSRKFNLPVDSLQKWNGPKLEIGQVLYLKRTVSRNTTPAAAPVAASNPVRTTPSTTAKASTVEVSKVKAKQRLLVIPFDPYLYFSDADFEIARQSKIPRQNVRHVFRGRLNALLAPDGYETIHLLGGVYRDSVDELSKLYKSLSYSYQENKQSRYNQQPVVKNDEKGGVLNWVKDQKEKLHIQDAPAATPLAKDPTKHFGVQVKDGDFFNYFNNQYDIDYYVFINQFEVKTNYENCLDRAAMNYERNFLVHYSIYDSRGELISGNKVKVPYHSNMNDVQRIVSENMPKVAERVLSDLPAGK
jgi:hypothetical protein